MYTNELGSTRGLEREQAIELAGTAEVAEWCALRGIPLVKQVDGTYVRQDIPVLHMNGTHWYVEEQAAATPSEYHSGCLIEYVMQFEGMEFRQAVEEIIAEIAPGTWIRWEDEDMSAESPPQERCIQLAVRAERARALLQSSKEQLQWR